MTPLFIGGSFSGTTCGVRGNALRTGAALTSVPVVQVLASMAVLCGIAAERTSQHRRFFHYRYWDITRYHYAVSQVRKWDDTCKGNYACGGCGGDEIGGREGDEMDEVKDDERGMIILRRPNKRASSEKAPGPSKAKTTAIMTTSRLNGLP